MKKIIALFLFLVMSVLLLVGCAEDEIGADLEDYKDKYQPEVREDLVLDFYIVVEEGTTENAIVTVERMINTYLSDLYKTKLDMHYLTADEYEATVTADVNKTGDDRADIVLVLGEDMFDSLYESHALANVADFLKDTKYGKLNTQISGTLLDATVVTENRTTHLDKPYTVDNRYVIPNNRVIGSYTYLLIDKEAARYVNYSNNDISSMLSYEATAELRQDLGDNGFDVDECVKIVDGMYADKAAYEKEGYFCNIVNYPTVDREEAYFSSFAVVRAENDLSYKNTKDPDPNADPETVVPVDTSYLSHYDRCMEVIYTLNSDVYLRNLLQYGVKGTNYTLAEDGSIVSNTEGPGVYNMNLLYTGDIFKAYYCENLGWNETVKTEGDLQNKQSVLPSVAEDE